LRILFEVLSGGALSTSLKDKEKKTSQYGIIIKMNLNSPKGDKIE
tara:strand:+ start:473 stop:607 length:135 start_codon:yes stop_codon:yes gene_type:complete